jgi:EAL domain-containing protein (putative c-di-GMP-specific phosphodiesterase class I)
MTTNNVVLFPKQTVVNQEVSPENFMKIMEEKGKVNFIENVVQEIAENAAQHMSDYGIDINSEQFVHDYSFALVVLRSAIYRSIGMEHPLHEFLDSNVVFSETELDTEQ